MANCLWENKRKQDRINNYTVKNYGSALTYSDVDCLYKFEPNCLGNNIINISKERYEELLEYAINVRNNSMNFEKSSSRIVTFSNKYSYALRKFIQIEKDGFFRYYKDSVYLTNDEMCLLIVLATDADLNYLNDYRNCKENNIDIEKFFLNKYSFYSLKLIYMELHTSIMYQRHAQKNNNIKR